MQVRQARHVSVAWLAVVAATGVVAGPAGRDARADVTGRQVQRAIEEAVAHLKSTQLASGHWKDYGGFTGGAAGLCVHALATAGVGKDDPVVRRGINALNAVQHEHTYVVAVKAMALAAADPVGNAAEIQRCANDLVNWQNDDGTWTYGPPAKFRRISRGDNSNTQYAILGLYEAAKAGAKVPAATFQASDAWFRRTVSDTGGWRYVGTSGQVSGTMTAAAVASLFITAGEAYRSQEKGFLNGEAPNCGRYRADVHIAAGMDWLARNFRVGSVPGGDNDVLFYWYYAFERVGVLTGQKYIGGHDWFKEGAERLVMLQQSDGGWPTGRYGKPINTALALLFLVKGRLPVLINKLKYPGEWAPDADDIKNLCAFVNANKVFTDAVGWQAVDIDASVKQWADAPLVYLTGHRFPELTPQQADRMREFLAAGGTMLVEACCGRPEFDRGFRAFVAKVLPEYTLSKLDPTHPVYRTHFDFSADPPVLFGVDLACRTSIIYSPRDLSCLWQQADINSPDPAMKAHTIRAYQLGANVAAYAAGREPLRDKLSEVVLPETARRPDDVPQTVRGAVQIAQLQHAGDWKPCVRAVPNLARLIRDQAGVDVADKQEAIRFNDPALFAHPIVFLTGHHKFELTAEEKTALKRYLERGGFLFAESCCGRQAFDNSFRALMAELFPAAGQGLAAMKADHPLLTGRDAGGRQFGFDVRKVKYRPVVLREKPGLDAPTLETVSLGGRPAVIYSPYSVGCGLDGMICGGCRGLEADDARKLSVNIVVFALTN